MMQLRLIQIPLVLLVMLVATACSTLGEAPELSALAKPDIEDITGEPSFALGCADLGYGFEIIADVSLNIRIIDFFDQKTHELKRVHVIWRTSVTFSHSETGESTSAQERGVDIYDIEEGTVAVVGIINNVTVPGKGVVVQSVGRLVIDLETLEVIFEAGPHVLGLEALALLCEAFA